ncbi:glycoside hydrolase family 3 C-terminal domain-containing protein [Eubacteriales bacterium OttesenSCG-928-A19]|nr:glycoside hydrolase family 3 C-terminal domain-containing protein [Eubacteriales bacterium OttesenSCG-928-A19]
MLDRKFARERAQALVDRMTLEEKASQLRYDSPAIERLGIPAYNWWNEALHGVARAGTATVFPQAIGLAAIFDEAFHERVAEVIATEGRAKYNATSAHGDRDIYKGLTFWSPNINIFRDPRWGRGHETYGEDPWLTTRLGVAFVRGLQGDGDYLKSAACAKHFAVHSGPEAVRHEFDAIATPKDMWETYLPAFEALVREANVEAVMGAYNRVNGEPACGSKTLLHDILRGQWGFEGHVVSDCWAIRDFHTHHMVTATAPESAALALENGCDVNCGVTYLHLLQAHQEGLVTEEQIATSAVRLMTTRILLGLFDEGCAYNSIPYTDNDTDEHDALALAAAEKSMVLLKNDGILPLSTDTVKTIAVIGPNANSIPALEGNYYGTSSRYVTFLEGIRAACDGRARVLYAQGSDLSRDRLQKLAQARDDFSQAVTCAELADVVVLCVGLDATLEGEEGDTGNEYFSGDKADLELPAIQRELIRAVVATGKPVITVLSAGSAIRVEEGNAILLSWYPGQAGGTALANMLFGKTSPSGKLPVTFYRAVDDLPAFEDYAMEGRTYRYFTGEVLYPFGYGLTYGDVALSDLTVVPDGDAYAATVSVRNAGARDVEEVVQAYIRAEESPWSPPNASLCAFGRVALAAGETKRVTLTIPATALTVVNDKGERVSGGPRYALAVGVSQPDPRSVQLAGVEPLRMELTI